jgi:dolichyl-phosphate-mannose-protein mannosyltransferase
MSIDVPPPLTLTDLQVELDTDLSAELRAPVSFRRTPSRLPAHSAPTRTDRLLTRAMTSRAIWLVPLLIVQAWFAFRLTNSLEQDEALYINAGHQLIAHILHGTRSPAFGAYFSGVPALYSVPAAMLDYVGGPTLVHAANTVMVMLATVFVYLTTRRLFGSSAALIGAGIFAVNPATIFVGRFASFDAPSLLLLAVATYLAVRATDNWRFALALGPCLALASAEKYFALAFIPSVFAIMVIVGVQRVGRRRTLRAAALALAGLLVAGGIAALLIAPLDWRGLMGTSLNRTTLLPEGRLALLRECFGYIGGLTIAAVLAVGLLRRRWVLGGALLLTSLIPALVQIRFSESASLHKNLAFGVLFLAPLVGVTGTALLRRGRLLGLRAPIALACVVLVLSSGMGTSSAMVHGWPNSTKIDAVLAHYVQRGQQKYLVDDSDIPEYYLSGLTNYSQWDSTFAPIYQGPHGAQYMRDHLENGYYTVFLYRDEGSTIGLDNQMLTILHRRYTLVAKVPMSAGDTQHFWYLWLAELPR